MNACQKRLFLVFSFYTLRLEYFDELDRTSRKHWDNRQKRRGEN